MKNALAIGFGLTASFGYALVTGEEIANSGAAGLAQRNIALAHFARAAAVNEEHRNLAYFAGDWSSVTSIWFDQTKPPINSQGHLHSELILGGRFLDSRYDGTFFNAPLTGRGLIGYENERHRFVSSWIDSSSTSMWIGYGSYDSTKQTYTFVGTREDPMGGSPIEVREEMHELNADHYEFVWYERRGASDLKTMQVVYSRSL